MKNARALMALLAAAVLLAAGAAMCRAATTYDGPPAEPYKLGGLSFISEKNLDVLRMSAPVGVAPQVYRHAIPQRVVLRFDNTQPMPSLLNLVAGKRGDCVEKIEVQTLRNYAEGLGDIGGVRKLSQYSTLVVVYVPEDVDAKVNTDAGVIEMVFQRVRQEPTKPSPLPVNSLVDVTFELLENTETITFFFAEPVVPSVYEEITPHRLLLVFPAVDVPVKVANQVRRFMQTPLLFRVEGFNLGSQPNTYPEMDLGRDFHFSTFPSPLADDVFADKIFGKQTRDAIFAFYPFENVTFKLPETEKNVVKIVFEKNLVLQPPMVCTMFEPSVKDPALLYNMEDEEGRNIKTPTGPLPTFKLDHDDN